MTTDAELFGLTKAQRMEEEQREAGRMYGGLNHCAVRDDDEAAEYTAEIMEAINAERCILCDNWYIPEEDGCPICPNCRTYDDQAWQDYRDERDMALAATNGTL